MIAVNLELTDHCNIRCKMCSQSMRDEAHGVPERFMEWSTWTALLEGLEDMDDEVHLCPHWLGEPTIHPQFDQFVEYAFAVNEGGRLFKEFKLHTNAVVLSEKRAELLVRLANSPHVDPSCFRSIHFSIDSFSREAYTEVKGRDHRDKVFANVERFLRVRESMGAVLPYAHLAFVVQPDNAHEALAFRDHWVDILEVLGRPHDVCYDWPHRDRDALYFRPLNTSDQDASDALHARVCHELGLVADGQQRLRAAGSF